MAEKIYAAMIGVMNDVKAVEKNSRNKQQGFAYRGIDDVMNALQPALIKNKVFVVPMVMEEKREERNTARGGVLFYSRLTVRYTFYADDGSRVEAITVGEAMDSGDKATNKAMSAAYKYACFQAFSIPTEEMIDPDAEVHQPVARQEVKQQVKDWPITPEELLELQKAIKVKAAEKLITYDQLESSVLAGYKANALNQLSHLQFENAMRRLKISKTA